MLELDISFGKHRADTNWKTEYLSWEEFVEKLGKVRRTAETMAEYDAMSKADKGNVKDGPAFVAGLIKGGRRKKESIDSRSMITLDIDYADDNFLFAAELVLAGKAYLVYSTHSHRPALPKYRLIVPLDRSVSPDEYSAISRKIAAHIGLSYIDRTTFDIHRLMYLPSCSKDATPVFEVFEGEALSADDVLAEYDDWKDISSWSRHEEDKHTAQFVGTRAQDPREKKGLIGLFCRAFTIQDGIDQFLSDVYETGSMEYRYNYLKGTSANGLEVYPSQDLAFSHQDSDPVATGHTYNLFDLVRIHKFGHLDDRVKDSTAADKRPSHLAMETFVSNLPEVKRLKMDELESELDGIEFEDIAQNQTAAEEKQEDPNAWKEKLELHSKTGEVLARAGNVELILQNGIWKEVLAYDQFGNSEVILKRLPWRKRERFNKDYEPWLAADDKRLQHWLAKTYKINSVRLIQNAFTEVVHRNAFHPIKSYLEATTWDGVPRAESIFIDYLGAEDTNYVRQVTRKMLLAAVSRIYLPGCKFDQMLVLVGPQGAGKSSLLAKLGRDWFSDSLRTFENKEAGEHLQNGWIFEIGELSAMKKTEVEEVKAFLSKTEDRYRVAYDRQVTEFPRKCIFFGTTNTSDFLRDMTGNRRFWPVTIRPELALYDHWQELDGTKVAQIWAEVMSWFKAKESLVLDDDARVEAEKQQAGHLEMDPRQGVIAEWLDEPMENEQGFPSDDIRTRTCAAQIWVECLGKKRGDMKAWEAKEITDMVRNIPGWIIREGKARVAGYGVQKVFERAD